MKINKIIEQMTQKYPGKKIIITDPTNPGEIICETEPTEAHPDWSEAIAVIDYTRLHYHRAVTETYEVLSGELDMVIQEKTRHLKTGETITIPPNTRHKAFGRETLIRVSSKPGWTPEDHILVTDGKDVSRRIYDKT
ncbi:MAG: cupin domain-containing protein [Candidatus Pacebacteria bacterium]|nr:cupin domain-containing protein [Candidatus Paceibacterota bacterium]